MPKNQEHSSLNTNNYRVTNMMTKIHSPVCLSRGDGSILTVTTRKQKPFSIFVFRRFVSVYTLYPLQKTQFITLNRIEGSLSFAKIQSLFAKCSSNANKSIFTLHNVRMINLYSKKECISIPQNCLHGSISPICEPF